MNQKSIIAFRKELLEHKDLKNMNPAQLKINNRARIGILFSHVSAICDILGIEKEDIAYSATRYQDVYLASIKKRASKTKNKNTIKNGSDALRKKYVKLCNYGRTAKYSEILKKDTTKLKKEVELYQSKLTAALRKLENTESALSQSGNTTESRNISLEKEFDILLSHPDIEKIEISDNRITTYTNRICITHAKKHYDIGKFKIVIYTTGRVRMFNLTRKVYDHHHPHIDEDGVPCLGNIQETLPNMIGEYKYAAAIALYIQYLKSYTHSEWYTPRIIIVNWPLTSEEENHE